MGTSRKPTFFWHLRRLCAWKILTRLLFSSCFHSALQISWFYVEKRLNKVASCALILACSFTQKTSIYCGLMLKDNMWHMCRTYQLKNYFNDNSILYVSKFDYEISKTANEIPKILGTVKKVVSYR